MNSGILWVNGGSALSDCAVLQVNAPGTAQFFASTIGHLSGDGPFCCKPRG